MVKGAGFHKSNDWYDGPADWSDLVAKARSQLILTQPFFGVLALYMKVIEDDGTITDTMATDGDNLYVYPEFVADLSEANRVFVIAHEVMHVALEHHLRMKHRNPKLWNIATDYVINSELVKAGFTMPSCGLLDPKYEGMAAEEVYDLLERDARALQKALAQLGGGASDKDPGQLGGVIPAQGDAVQQANAQSELRIRVQQAAATAKASQAGKLPGIIEKIIQAAEPQVSWRAYMRQFVDSTVSTDYSFAKPNRRFTDQDIVLPGTIQDGVSRMVIAVDTSGSTFDPKQQAEFFGEIEGIVADVAIERVTVIYADAAVQRVEEFELGEPIKPNVKGGGGTNFRPTTNWIKENALDASVFIYFTDLETYDHGEDLGIPTLWLTYGSKSAFDRVSARVPYGTAFHMST